MSYPIYYIGFLTTGTYPSGVSNTDSNGAYYATTATTTFSSTADGGAISTTGGTLIIKPPIGGRLLSFKAAHMVNGIYKYINYETSGSAIIDTESALVIHDISTWETDVGFYVPYSSATQSVRLFAWTYAPLVALAPIQAPAVSYPKRDKITGNVYPYAVPSDLTVLLNDETVDIKIIHNAAAERDFIIINDRIYPVIEPNNIIAGSGLGEIYYNSETNLLTTL